MFVPLPDRPLTPGTSWLDVDHNVLPAAFSSRYGRVPIERLVKAVNLIPNEQRTAGKSPATSVAAPSSGGSAIGAYLVLGVLVFAVAASAIYVLTTNSIKTDKAELARVDQQAQVVQQQASSLQAFADFKTLSDARVATVSALAGARFDWQSALDDVSRALPADVYVNSFDGTTSSSGGGSSIRGAISAPAIELTGCTSNQASVARLMSRLRDVRGVTRVSLSKSEAQDVTSAAAAPAPAAADGKAATTIAEPCPKGSPPTFDVVVFFERAALSANAVPNAAAGTTAGPTGAAGPTGPTGATGAATPAPGATQPTSTTSTTP